VSTPTPLLDFFKRGQAAHDVRLLAAQGALAPRAEEQLAILIYLLDDSDPSIRAAATDTISRIPVAALASHLARSDVSIDVREFFADRGVFPAEIPPIETGEPLYEAPSVDPVADAEDGDDAGSDDARLGIGERVARMNFSRRLVAAMRGSREMRAFLIRDPNKAIATAVLSSPKLNENEVESFARMPNVAEEVLRIIGSNRMWMRNYGIMVGLAKNPKTPLAMSLNLLGRLNDRDVSMLSIDRNVPEPLRVAARRRVVDSTSSRE
jgi:hypothetical protein